MNFDLTQEQQLLKDSVERFVADNYSLEARIKLTDAEPGFSKAHWQSMAELGWLALPFAEEDGADDDQAREDFLRDSESEGPLRDHDAR